ncbi:MAG: FkbM family methyltransferase, partial [Bacillota bacterium]
FYRIVSKIPNYLRAFGVLNGLRLLFLIEGSFVMKKRKKYNVPGYPSPIYLRKTVADRSIFWQCIVEQQYGIFKFPQKKRLMSTYNGLVEEGLQPVIIDCGGNIGLSTLYLAIQYPEAKIYTIEPDEDNFEILRKNTAFLGERVVALKGGIWNESQNLRIVNPESGSTSFRVTSAVRNSCEAVQAFTINEICEIAGVQYPFIVKIDIAGAQNKLFEKNTKWVRGTHLIMLELDDWLMPWKGTSRNFFSCVSQYPFDYLIDGETIFCFHDFEAMD